MQALTIGIASGILCSRGYIMMSSNKQDQPALTGMEIGILIYHQIRPIR